MDQAVLKAMTEKIQIRPRPGSKSTGGSGGYMSVHDIGEHQHRDWMQGSAHINIIQEGGGKLDVRR